MYVHIHSCNPWEKPSRARAIRMLPTLSVKSICLSQGNFLALMGTTIALTAAATFWCVKGRRRCFWSRSDSKAAIDKASISSSPPNATPVNPVDDETLSYLCTSCGTEKYSPDQVAANGAGISSSSPYKMVILVRTDLNMVRNHTDRPDFNLNVFRERGRWLHSAVMQFWLLLRVQVEGRLIL